MLLEPDPLPCPWFEDPEEPAMPVTRSKKLENYPGNKNVAKGIPANQTTMT
jgi:hypothetical protein